MANAASQKSGAWYVYGLFVKKRLRYIGVTDCAMARLGQHKTSKYRGMHFELTILDVVEEYDAAVAREAELIRAQRPCDNVVHNPDRWSPSYREMMRKRGKID